MKPNGRMYYVPMAGQAVTNAGGNTDLFELLVATAKAIELRKICLGQTTEVADAASEAVELQIIRMTATITGSNGTATTPVPAKSGVTAALFTAAVNGATVATTSGTATIVASIPWNIQRSPVIDLMDLGLSIRALPGEGLFVRLISTVADDVTFGGYVVVEEE